MHRLVSCLVVIRKNRLDSWLRPMAVIKYSFIMAVVQLSAPDCLAWFVNNSMMQELISLN